MKGIQSVVMPSRDDAMAVSLLGLGLYLPSSTGGVFSTPLVWLSFILLLGILSWTVWDHGTRPRSVSGISLPILIVLAGSTFFLTATSVINWGVFGIFVLLALMFSLNLSAMRPGRAFHAAFVAANIVNIVCGAAIIAGSESMGRILITYYSVFYPELVPLMIQFHKPVLMFGTHSLAAFFFYLFFWINWETYRERKDRLALLFAVGNLILLLAETSFTAVAFSALAMFQLAVWLWSNNRKVLVMSSLTLLLAGTLGWAIFTKLVPDWEDLGAIAMVLPNSDVEGVGARYGPNGALQPAINYLIDHPFSPTGFSTPLKLAEGLTPLTDSGPIEYVLRGSLPALVLIYFGLFRFLRFNLILRRHALTLFFVIVIFELGFSWLKYIRTLYLLPMIVIYLNAITLGKSVPSLSDTEPTSGTVARVSRRLDSGLAGEMSV